jgi:hypothetical protein
VIIIIIFPTLRTTAFILSKLYLGLMMSTLGCYVTFFLSGPLQLNFNSLVSTITLIETHYNPIIHLPNDHDVTLSHPLIPLAVLKSYLEAISRFLDTTQLFLIMPSL